MPASTVERIHVPHCDLDMTVTVGGSGPPLVYLHTAGGPVWDPFLDALAEHHTVYSPDHPGTGNSVRESIHQVDTLWDLVLVYDDLLRELDLSGVPLIGSSFGGMMACELAAHRPEAIERLVLIDPIGLWRDDNPVASYMLMPPEQLMATLFADTSSEFVQGFLTMPEDPQEMAVAIADSVWALATTGKFVWPIPDKGLSKRLHRISAPALIVWGSEDKLISSVYAEDFAAAIGDSRVEILQGAGHVPQWERTDEVAELVLGFLGD
jgi:pimeloyl-ACP methyl ester carboxylesterase